MKTISIAVVLLASAAWADEGEARIVQVGLHMQEQQLLSMTMGKTREVYVTIDSDNPSVELQKIDGIATGYVGGRAATVISTERVCRAPCKELVAVSDVTDFYIAGDGVTGSRALDLSQYGDSVNLRVKAGSSGRRMGGIMSVIGGGALVLCGGLFAGLFSLMPSEGSDNIGGTFIVGGLVTAGIGAVLLALGIILLPGSGTEVDMEQGSAVPPGQAPAMAPAHASSNI